MGSKAPWSIEVARTIDNPKVWPEVKRLSQHALGVDGDAIGFLPWETYQVHHVGGRVLTCRANGDLVGFLMWRFNRQREARCLQVWVRSDARMLLHGRALTDAWRRDAIVVGCSVVRLYCAEDLAANIFWRMLGFTQSSWRYGPSGRKHLLWVSSLGGLSDGRGLRRSDGVAIASAVRPDAKGEDGVGQDRPAQRRRFGR